MKITFDIYSFRDLQKGCGAVLATREDERHGGLTRISLTAFQSGRDCICRAYGSNGYQVTRIDVPCELSEVPDENEQILLEPVKIPAKSAKVILSTDKRDELELTFLDKNGKETGVVKQPKMDVGLPLDFGKMCRKFSDQIDQYNTGMGQYCIAVNPKYLMNALVAFQDCEDGVIINFGNAVQPFMIRPCGDEQNTTAYVFPVRFM